MSVREYRRPEEMGDFQRTARVITELTYQERLLRVGLPATAEFLRKLVREAEEDNVRSYVLFHADRPIAFAYCSSRGRNLTYQVIGYDPDYRNFSPGRVLLYLMLEALFREGRYDKFDFGAGEAFYKSFFATDSVQCMDVYYFRPTARNWFTLQARTALVALSRALVRISESLHIKDTLKKWLREKSAG
jgi:CelD/BcsL family acetyltransferase involved in cellulose biosynthesis